MRIALVIALIAAFHAQEPKKYMLVLEAADVVGAKVDVVLSDAMSMLVQVEANGEKQYDHTEKNVAKSESTLEVLKVRDRRSSEERWTIRKGTVSKDGVETTPDFLGKAIIVTTAEDKSRTLAFEGGAALSKEQAELFWKCSGVSSKAKHGDNAMAMMTPKKPIAVGESWTPDAKEACETLGRSMKLKIDPKDFTATLTLKSVEKRGGSEYGRVTFDSTVLLREMNNVTLEKPFSMKVSMDAEFSIDGTQPDGSKGMTMSMGGTSPTEATETVPSVTVTMDMSAKRTESRTIAK